MAVPATHELVAALADELAVASFDDGQENGLQVEGRGGVETIVGAVSVNAETIGAAVDRDADALLTHHGLLWQREPLHVRGVKRQRLRALLANDVNLLTYHLPLDAHPKLGNNAALADAAGCAEAEPAFAYHGQTIGMVGSLAKPRRFGNWVMAFEETLRKDVEVPTGLFQVWPFGPEKIERIGFVSGGAPHQVHDAIDAGCDAYVTGEPAEAVYHLAKEAGIHFVAGGHYLTERLGVQRLGAWLVERFGVTFEFVDVGTEV